MVGGAPCVGVSPLLGVASFSLDFWQPCGYRVDEDSGRHGADPDTHTMSDCYTIKHGDLTPGQRVRVHRNLQNGLWSVTDPKTRRVICHVPSIALDNATPKVSLATMRTIRAKNRRRVGAWIEGTVSAQAGSESGEPLRFNPHRGDTFTLPSGADWTGGGTVSFTANHGCGFLSR